MPRSLLTSLSSLLLLFISFLLLSGCEAVDDVTGVNDAKVGQSLKESQGTLTRKELSLRLRRLAMSYLGDIPEVCEEIASAELPLDKRVLALRIRANSTDSVISIAADPDPQVALLNMVTVLTLHQMLAEERGVEFFGELGGAYLRATTRLEDEAWQLADMVLDDEEEQQLRGLIQQYRTDNPDEVYVWWVRFAAFSGYQESFSIASVGRGVVDLFLPVGDAVAGIETTSDVAERATWLLARQSQIAQWRVELTLLQALAVPETAQLFEEVQRVSDSINNLPKTIADERQAILKAIEDQESSLNQLLKQTAEIVSDVKQTGEEANKIVQGVDDVVQNADQTVQRINETIKQADTSITNAKAILPETESALAQLDTTSKTLSETIQTLDTFVRQFESEDDGDESARPFDINEYTLAIQEAGKTAGELNTLIGNLDQAVQPDRLDATLGSVKGELSALIWQGGLVLLGAGLVLILAAKLIPKRAAA